MVASRAEIETRLPGEREGCVSLSQQQRSLGQKVRLAGGDFVMVNDAMFLCSVLTVR